MKDKSTIYDIAKKANVSTTTVYKVLHNKKGVSETRRQEILTLAKQLHYSSNTVAQALARKEIKIGIIAEVFNPEFGNDIISGVKFSLNELKDHKVTGYFGRLENSLNKDRVSDRSI